jgi:hypothetical protein
MQRTVSPQPSTSKQLSNRKLITESSSSPPSSSDDIELIDPPPNLPASTVRPQRKKGLGKASESRPNGKVPESQSKGKAPESQAKGKAPESQAKAKDTHFKPKPAKPAANKLPFPVPIAEDPSNHSEPAHEPEKAPLSPRIHKELERWKAKTKDVRSIPSNVRMSNAHDFISWSINVTNFRSNSRNSSRSAKQTLNKLLMTLRLYMIVVQKVSAIDLRHSS